MSVTHRDVIQAISDDTGISQADVKLILKAQASVAKRLLAKADEQERINIIPGAVAIYKLRREATQARIGRHPITGQPTQFRAKPAAWRVKASVRKALKDALSN